MSHSESEELIDAVHHLCDRVRELTCMVALSTTFRDVMTENASDNDGVYFARYLLEIAKELPDVCLPSDDEPKR